MEDATMKRVDTLLNWTRIAWLVHPPRTGAGDRRAGGKEDRHTRPRAESAGEAGATCLVSAIREASKLSATRQSDG